MDTYFKTYCLRVERFPQNGLCHIMEDAHLEIAASGLSAFQAGDHVKAIELFSGLTKQNPELWESRLCLAIAYLHTSRFQDASQELKAIAQSCPKDAIKEQALTALGGINSQSHNKLKTTRSRK